MCPYALGNPDRVPAATETVLTRDGLNGLMCVTARETGVGVRTIYRQYPAKEALCQDGPVRPDAMAGLERMAVGQDARTHLLRSRRRLPVLP